MNYKTLIYLIGQVALASATLMLLPFILTFVHNEEKTPLAFGVTIAFLLIVVIVAFILRPKKTDLTGRSGFVCVALGWIFLSITGSLPFALSGVATNYIDALFETVSGFTTTGASIFENTEMLPKSLLMWRAMAQWLGGMGVLVFIVAIIPEGSADAIHLMKAETPGPQFGKLVSKLRFSARILYAIYIVMTIVEGVMLLCGGMDLFDATLHAFSTAGTGGFSSRNLSIGAYNNLYFEIVITVFMLLFAINFNVFYFILIGKVSSALRSEELRTFVIIVAVSILSISISLTVENVYESFQESLRYSSFQVASVVSTTGFSLTDFSSWPVFTHIILLMLSFVGGCAGSTAGGFKVSRLTILFKNGLRYIKKTLSPRAVVNVKLDGHALSENVVDSVNSYLMMYVLTFFTSLVLLTIGLNTDFSTAFSSVTSCFNNVGVSYLGTAIPYNTFTPFAKIVLIFDMLLGRLEILPLLLLFYPKTWSRI